MVNYFYGHKFQNCKVYFAKFTFLHFFCIFFQKNLHISKKSSIFAPDLEIVLIITLKNYNYENNQNIKRFNCKRCTSNH